MINRIYKIIIDYIFCFCLLLLLAILSLLAGLFLTDTQSHKESIIFLATPMILIIASIFLILAISYVPLYKQLKNYDSKTIITKEINVYKIKTRKYAINKNNFVISVKTLYYLENNKKKKLYYIPSHNINYYKDKTIGIKTVNIFKDSMIIESFRKIDL